MSTDVRLTSLGNGAFEILLDRPERMNALGVATVEQLLRAIEQANAENVRVLLIRGNGRAFCAGADLKERKGMDLDARMAHNAGINEANNAIAACSCVTIAVLNGLALGGGLEMAMSCDLRLAAEGIKIGLTESRVGAFPGAGGTQRLPRLIGASRALHMMLIGEPVTSEYGLSIGLVNEVHGPDALVPRAHQLAALLCNRSLPAVAAMKRLVMEGGEQTLAEGLRLERAALPPILSSADYAEGLLAFEERRPPRFTDTVDGSTAAARPTPTSA
jgi:enoyl-CoA hydratase/carnithine racemase